MKVGDQVVPSGLGKTLTWKTVIGVISKISKNRIFVIWNDTSFEDELEIYEILLFSPDLLLKFNDGIEIYTGGEYRIIEETDGFYVTGEGKLIPVKSRQEGEEIIHQIKEKEKLQIDDLLKLIDLKIEVSLNDLIQLNKISIDNGYNRNLVENFYLYLNSESRFNLQPLLTHHYKNGIKCEPHMRYLITQISPSDSFRSIIDLPLPVNLKKSD
jgi:hypothetical protein